ncbi:hypothetical protein CANINC_003720 [Pichia inconspicua]|uniref:TOG domain-containing protein n=1 Tax=Pichia inconspicua TaxID=52247 RepID=A0A4T0WYA8_9ASCO|nr:hypothetical protein CANINC_003720 [[Candida] inconspicua]
MADEEYTSLPIDNLLAHKLWKARQHGYEQLKTLAEANTNDPQVQSVINNPDILRKIVADANVIAQESGIDFLVVVLQKSNPKTCTNTRDSVVPALVEKGITSSRANAKANATESLLIYVQKDSPEKVIELMIPSLNAKSPKQVVATIKAVDEIYKSFGCLAVSPKLILESVCKMFAHSDKNVRAEATKLAVTIRSYIGDAFDTVVFPKIKPIQQKDLTALFIKIDQIPTPTRKLYEEEQKLLQKNIQLTEDVEMTDIIYTTKEDLKIDPYDLETPVDVLSKIPSNLSERLLNPVWKERVEVLEEISKIFKVVRIENDDFSYFVSLMATCIKDVNLQVVTLACGILTDLAKGLKSNFGRYVSTLINPLLERTKEKKKSVVDALKNVLDLCFEYGSFNEVIDSILEHMVHISPLVKIESMNFLVRCLRDLQTPISKHHEEQIMATATKLLQDSQLGVRNSASEVLGTMMKILGPEKSKRYLEKVDKRHVKKVEQIRDVADVKISKGLVSAETFVEVAKITDLITKNNNNEGSLIESNYKTKNQQVLRPPAPSKSSIPSKRTATSPIKENIPNHKNALTSRSLKASSSTDAMSTQQLQELELLKAEKQELIDSRKNLTTQLEALQASNAELMKDVVSLNNKLDDYHDKFTTMNMTLKSKDTQLFRLRSDLESSNARNAQLQQKVRYLESQLENQGQKTTKTSDEDINRRISILSIDSSTQDAPETSLNLAGSTLFTMNDNDDEWKRATAATNELKAKIQRMKARTRIIEPTED